MVTYREAEPRDVAALVALVARCDALSPWLDVVPAPEQEEERLAQHIGDERHWLVVAEEDGEPVGFASLRPYGTDEACHLSNLFVEPERWGQGLGRGLLEQAVAELRRRCCPTGTLSTHTANERARRIYERLGWRDTGRRRLNREGEEMAEYELPL